MLSARLPLLLPSALRKEDGSYAPAHLLADNRMERAGRRSTDAARAARPPPTSAPGIEVTAVGASAARAGCPSSPPQGPLDALCVSGALLRGSIVCRAVGRDWELAGRVVLQGAAACTSGCSRLQGGGRAAV